MFTLQTHTRTFFEYMLYYVKNKMYCILANESFKNALCCFLDEEREGKY